MYGWRAKIGVVVPSNNTILEPEFWRMLPEGVSAHTTRIRVQGTNPEAIADMERNTTRALQELYAGKMDGVAYACLATSLVKGPGWSESFISGVRSGGGLPATTAGAAMVEALKFLGIDRVAVATPYPEAIHSLLPPFFRHYGVQVVGIRNLEIHDPLEVGSIPSQVAYRLAREANSPEAEAVLIVATDFQTVDMIEVLERDLGKPVVTTNQALLWDSLRLTGVREVITGYGKLLRTL